MRELGERPGTTLWSSSSGWGLRACSWHEQSIAVLSRAYSFVSVSLCFISQCVRKHYLMIFNLILCSIFRQKTSTKQKKENKSWKAILQVSDKLNLLMNLNRVKLIVLGFFKFSFSHWFYRRSVGGSVRGSVFCRNPKLLNLLSLVSNQVRQLRMQNVKPKSYVLPSLNKFKVSKAALMFPKPVNRKRVPAQLSSYIPWLHQTEGNWYLSR